MPTIFELFGIRYYFYSGEHEPLHVHFENADGKAKVNLEPKIELIYNHGIKPNDLKKAMKTITLYKDEIIKRWYEYFDH